MPLQPVRPEAGSLLYVTVRDALHDAVREGRFAPGQRLPSTKDLAAQLGVSLVTTHRAMQALEARGILDRVQGRGTFVTERSERRTRRLAVVLQPHASLADYYHGELLDGMSRGARESGAELLIQHATEPARRVVAAANGSSPDRPWGGHDAHLLINPLAAAAEAFARTLSEGVPSLLVGAHAEGMPHVDVDNADLVRQALEHLSGLGHRRILFVGGAGRLSNSRDWRESFIATCEQLGIDGSLRFEADSWRLTPEEEGQVAARLRGDDSPTAVIGAGYYLTLDVYEIAGTLGLSIPADLSVIGVGDPGSARHLSPPLTALHQPLVELGEAAVTRICSMLDGEDGGSVNLKAELIVRASCGPVPG